MIWFYLLIATLYFWTFVMLYIGYHRVTYFEGTETVPEIKFSIIIPFRNEAENLPGLLVSLQQLKYPTGDFEIIFVNDTSTDFSEEVILNQLQPSELNFQILQNTPNRASPKKTAITKAISVAKHPWIITTDADCFVPSTWLQIVNDFVLQNEVVAVVMPVVYAVDTSFLQHYQQLDNWSLQAVTVGSFGLGNILLSNGANFAYTKQAFQKVNGFEGNLHIASGDDMFLLEKFKEIVPKQIGYLKSRDAVVTTQPVTTWKHLISQRVRWASKTSKQKSVASKLLGVLVFTLNVLLLVAVVSIIFWPQNSIFVSVFVFYKVGIDYLLLRNSSRFFKESFPFLSFLGSTFVYPIVTIIVVLSSFSGTYLWKERSFKKQQRQG